MIMRYTQVCLNDFGSVLPPVVLSSDAIEERLQPLYERLKLPVGRLELMTGIKTRRLWQPGTRPSSGAAAAGASGHQPRPECRLLIWSACSSPRSAVT